MSLVDETPPTRPWRADEKDSLRDLVRRCVVEFTGTFFLVLFVGLTSLPTVGPLGPLVPGITLMVCIFAGGHISLGCYNPAVTLAFTLRPGLLSWKACLCYVLSQLLAGVAASLVSWGMGGTLVPSAGDAHWARKFFAELLGSFALVSVALNAGTSADYEGNSFFGLAIGFVLVAGAILFGGLSGAVFNPAVGILAFFAPVHSPTASIPPSTWIYFIAP